MNPRFTVSARRRLPLRALLDLTIGPVRLHENRLPSTQSRCATCQQRPKVDPLRNCPLTGRCVHRCCPWALSRRSRSHCRCRPPNDWSRRSPARSQMDDCGCRAVDREVQAGRRGRKVTGPPGSRSSPRTARTFDSAIGKSLEVRSSDATTATAWTHENRLPTGSGRSAKSPAWSASIRTCCGPEFIMAALDAGVPLRDVQIAARHADPRTTTSYDRRARTTTATPPTPWSPSSPAADRPGTQSRWAARRLCFRTDASPATPLRDTPESSCSRRTAGAQRVLPRGNERSAASNQSATRRLVPVSIV